MKNVLELGYHERGQLRPDSPQEGKKRSTDREPATSPSGPSGQFPISKSRAPVCRGPATREGSLC